MRKVIFVITILASIAAATYAQDKAPNRFSFLLGYSGNEFQPNPAEAAEYANGFFIEANGRILSRGKFRLDGTVNFRRTFDQTLESEYPVPPEGPVPASVSTVAIRRDVDTISAGPKVSVEVVKRVRVYGTALFGRKKFKFSPVDGSDEYNQFSRRYQFGGDLELGHFVIRPFYFEKEFTKGLLASSANSYGAGVGFRF